MMMMMAAAMMMVKALLLQLSTGFGRERGGRRNAQRSRARHLHAASARDAGHPEPQVRPTAARIEQRCHAAEAGGTSDFQRCRVACLSSVAVQTYRQRTKVLLHRMGRSPLYVLMYS